MTYLHPHWPPVPQCRDNKTTNHAGVSQKPNWLTTATSRKSPLIRYRKTAAPSRFHSLIAVLHVVEQRHEPKVHV
jgi:hypothetical protein